MVSMIGANNIFVQKFLISADEIEPHPIRKFTLPVYIFTEAYDDLSDPEL